MRTIVIKDILFYILNLKEDPDKSAFMENQMKALGLKFSFVNAVKASPGFVGVALSHLKALRQSNAKVPFAIIEDDTQFYDERFQEELIIPDNTDGIYLGHSNYGVRETDRFGLQWGQANNAKYEIFNNDFLQIKSMLARHAIIYVSDKFRQNAIKANLKALLYHQFPYPGDMAYAQIQKDHLLLSPHHPWCYQSEKHKGHYHSTRHSILEILPIQTSTNASSTKDSK